MQRQHLEWLINSKPYFDHMGFLRRSPKSQTYKKSHKPSCCFLGKLENSQDDQDDMEREVDAYLRRKFEAAIKDIELVHMEDLELKNHLSGLKRKLLRVSYLLIEMLRHFSNES